MNMKSLTKAIINNLSIRYPVLATNDNDICVAVETLITAYTNGNKLLICGNGGSAADALHTVGELMKAFVLPRKIEGSIKERILAECEHGQYMVDNLQGALPAISLVNEVSLQTAYANDIASDLDFAQQVYGYGKAGDVFVAISTSGNSKNVLYASEIAKVKGVKVIGLTGKTGGKLKQLCDVLINVDEAETYKIQELHLPVYHAICLALENEFFGE